MERIAFILMLVTIISKIFGFGREIVLSYFYWASSTSDDYLISLTILIAIFFFIRTGISAGYIPMYSNAQQQYEEKEENRFTSNLSNILIIICTIMIILGFIFT